MTEKEKLKLLNEDMWCNKYEMECEEVPFEVITHIGPFGFSDYDCDLLCNKCSQMEEI